VSATSPTRHYRPVVTSVSTSSAASCARLRLRLQPGQHVSRQRLDRAHHPHEAGGGIPIAQRFQSGQFLGVEVQGNGDQGFPAGGGTPAVVRVRPSSDLEWHAGPVHLCSAGALGILRHIPAWGTLGAQRPRECPVEVCSHGAPPGGQDAGIAMRRKERDGVWWSVSSALIVGRGSSSMPSSSHWWSSSSLASSLPMARPSVRSSRTSIPRSKT
jgi:hypothetical protein